MVTNYLYNIKDILRLNNSTCDEVDVLTHEGIILNIIEDLVNEHINFTFDSQAMTITLRLNAINMHIIGGEEWFPILLDSKTKETIDLQNIKAKL